MLWVLSGSVALAISFAIGVELQFQSQEISDSIHLQLSSLPKSTVVIVPGAAVHGNIPSNILYDRLECGIKIYKSQVANKILLSGDNGKAYYNELKPMLEFMLKNGVSEADIFVDHAGFRTLDTLIRAKLVFLVKDGIFVSQSVFLPRALYTSKHLGLQIQGFACDPRTYQKSDFYSFREILARHLAWWDLHIWETPPKFLGNPHPIEGSGISTWKGSIVP